MCLVAGPVSLWPLVFVPVFVFVVPVFRHTLARRGCRGDVKIRNKITHPDSPLLVGIGVALVGEGCVVDMLGAV